LQVTVTSKEPEYAPLAWFAARCSVAPTRSSLEPEPSKLPVPEGRLWKLSTVSRAAPLMRGSEVGRRMANVTFGLPEAVKLARVKELLTGVTPPEDVRVPRGLTVTVPAISLAAILPKVRSVFV
jgi:hypothetical protein